MESALLYPSPAPWIVLALVVAGCGGKTVGGSMDAGSSFMEPDGATCVTIDLSTYDRSCSSSSDCISITTGTLCSGSCACGGATVNASGQARYEAAIQGIATGLCACGASGEPACVEGTCTICPFGSECLGDAGATSDSGVAQCVEIDLADYDRSCTQPSDCIDIQTGKVCDGSCACGGTPVNTSGEAKYEAAISGVRLGACPCPASGPLGCEHGVCVQCDAVSGCGDGG